MYVSSLTRIAYRLLTGTDSLTLNDLELHICRYFVTFYQRGRFRTNYTKLLVTIVCDRNVAQRLIQFLALYDL